MDGKSCLPHFLRVQGTLWQMAEFLIGEQVLHNRYDGNHFARDPFVLGPSLALYTNKHPFIIKRRAPSSLQVAIGPKLENVIAFAYNLLKTL